jgi:hypothetical protein
MQLNCDRLCTITYTRDGGGANQSTFKDALKLNNVMVRIKQFTVSGICSSYNMIVHGISQPD